MNLPNLKEARKRTSTRTQIKREDFIIDEATKTIGTNKKYFIQTYGCQMNVHDSENMAAIMEEMSYTNAASMEDADIIIFNTCAIRENAHNKVFGMLGRVKHLKEHKPNIMTVFAGCMAQEESIALEIKNKYKWIDVVIGTHNIHKLPIYIKNAIVNQKQEIEVYSIEGDIIEGLPVKRDSKYKAWVNIMYGCDKFCTYCIVPYTRGKQRSRHKDDIITEVNDLIKKGYKEVTLLGQNVNAYGKDLETDYNMANLLEDVAKTGIPRVRFMTSHPWDFTEEMIKTIAKYENIMPYVHLPLQSGSTRILKNMGRRYTKEEYIKLFKKIKEYIPECAITTDIIVGFPNETKEDFQDTLDVVNELKYDLAYTFIYSPREGTPAAIMKDDITSEEKKERLQELNQLINKYANENNQKYLNKTVEVLIEGPAEKEDRLMGYTDTMKLVNIKGSKDNIGKIVKVRITDIKTWSLDGEIIND